MDIEVTTTHASSILTRASGYLRAVASHSLQPYRGCSFGRSLCGVGCYVQHSAFVTRGRPWGDFLEVKTNAAALYRRHHARERDWAHRAGKPFTIFMSSATDPFVPHERQFGITRALLESMVEQPPEGLIVQTHTHLVAGYLALLRRLEARCQLRVHLSIESDRDRLPGLPPSASSVHRRLEAAATLKRAGIRVVITVAPLLPIADPRAFFTRIAASADAVVLDHFIGGDGSAGGARTLKTALPEAMAAVAPASTSLRYRDRMVALAREQMPGRVGVGVEGFAGHYA